MHIKTALGMHISVFQVGKNVYNYVLCLEINLAHKFTNRRGWGAAEYIWVSVMYIFFSFQSL